LFSQKNWPFSLEDQDNIEHVAHKENSAPKEHRASHVKQVLFCVSSHLPKQNHLQECKKKR
jgi:hypothetical protein